MKSKRSYKYLNTLIKIIVVLLAWIYVVYKIRQIENMHTIKDFFVCMNIKQITYFTLILVLMPVNWLIETIKWRNLINTIENISIPKAFKAIWAGVAVGSLTPNRIGEFGGRILFLQKKNRHTASGLTLYGDLSQFIITFVIGLSSFSILIKYYLHNPDLIRIKLGVIIISILALIISSIIYFKINKILKYLGKFSLFNKIKNKFVQTKEISQKLKTETLLLSTIRYLIFTSQFYLALKFFNIEINVLDAFISISSMYLATSVIPNIPFAEIGIRLSFSVLFLGLFTSRVSEILLASAVIYVVNILIPIIFGGIFIVFNDKSHYLAFKKMINVSK